jgi:hypothetical protein
MFLLKIVAAACISFSDRTLVVLASAFLAGAAFFFGAALVSGAGGFSAAFLPAGSAFVVLSEAGGFFY